MECTKFELNSWTIGGHISSGSGWYTWAVLTFESVFARSRGNPKYRIGCTLQHLCRKRVIWWVVLPPWILEWLEQSSWTNQCQPIAATLQLAHINSIGAINRFMYVINRSACSKLDIGPWRATKRWKTLFVVHLSSMNCLFHDFISHLWDVQKLTTNMGPFEQSYRRSVHRHSSF